MALHDALNVVQLYFSISTHYGLQYVLKWQLIAFGFIAVDKSMKSQKRMTINSQMWWCNMFETQNRPVDAREAFDAVEQERNHAQFSQAELCRRADINQSTYTRLISDPERTPHRRTVRKLRKALDDLRQPACAA